MRKISWYVFRKFSSVFLLCLIALLTIYLTVDFFEKLRKFLKYDADLALVFSFLGYRVPEIIFVLAPLAALMASILTVGGLNRTREITAMRSCGLSFQQIAMPFLVWSGLVSAIGLILTAVVIPLSNLKAEYVQTVLIKKKPEPLSVTPDHLWLRLGSQHLLEIDSIQEDGKLLKGISRYTLDAPLKLTEVVTADQASFSQGKWIMEQATWRQIGTGDRMQVIEQSSQELSLSLTPEDFENWLIQSPEYMTLYQLNDYIQRVTVDGHSPKRFLTDYWGRIAYSIVPIIMTLIGLSVSLRGSGLRSVGVAKGVGHTLAIGFLFWAAHSVGIVLGRNGAVLPIIGSWIATVMFFMVGTNLFLKLK